MRERWVRIVGRPVMENRLVKARGEDVDQVDIANELVVLLPRDPARDEDAEVSNRLVDGVHDRLTVHPDIACGARNANRGISSRCRLRTTGGPPTDSAGLMDRLRSHQDVLRVVNEWEIAKN
jgi:hypothetical protein